MQDWNYLTQPQQVTAAGINDLQQGLSFSGGSRTDQSEPQLTDYWANSGSDQLPYQSLDSGVGVVSSGYVPEASGYVASNGDTPGAVNYESSQTQDIGVDNSAFYDANSAGLSDNSSFDDAANSDYFVSTDGWGDNSGDNYGYDS